jgi:hypothetical protein
MIPLADEDDDPLNRNLIQRLHKSMKLDSAVDMFVSGGISAEIRACPAPEEPIGVEVKVFIGREFETRTGKPQVHKLNGLTVFETGQLKDVLEKAQTKARQINRILNREESSQISR